MTSRPAPGNTLSSPKVSQQDVDQAAGTGRVEVLDELWEESNGAVHPSSTGLQMAAAAGEIVTLEWALARRLGGFERLMDVAAWTARLSVLKWLLANGIEGCTVNAVNWAARSGHLKVLRWLRDNLGLHGCTSEGLEAAAIAGRVRVVAWLLRNSTQSPDRTPAVVGAASNGHADVLKLLLSAPTEEEKSGWAMALALRGGHRECVRLLQAAGWPAHRPLAAAAADGGFRDSPDGDRPGNGEEEPQLPLEKHGRENGRGKPPAEDDPRNAEEGGQMPLGGDGRGGVREGSGNDDRRCPSLQSEYTETFLPTTPPAEMIRDNEDGEDGQRARGAPHPCAERYLLPGPTEPAEPFQRRYFAAPRAPSATVRSSGRVLSMDMALPGPLPEEETPSYQHELLEAPVLRTPRLRLMDPAGGRQLCDWSTAPSCSTIGAPSTTSAHWSQDQGVGMLEGLEGFSLDEWRWFSEVANGVDVRNRCLDASGGMDGLHGVGELLSADGRKSRMRDVWSPVSGVAGAHEARLSLGALAQESQEPVISAYLSGLLRNQSNASPATHQCRHRSLPCGSRPGTGSKRPPSPLPARTCQSSNPGVEAPSPPWVLRPLPPGPRSPPRLASAASAATICSAGGSSSPRRLAQRRDRSEFSSRQLQRGQGPHCAALSGPLGDNRGSRVAAVGQPTPPATAPSGTLPAAAMAAARKRGRARTAPEHPNAPSSGRRGCGRDSGGRLPREESEWYEDVSFPAVGSGVPDAGHRRRRLLRQREEHPCCPVGCRGGDAESALVCRGWGVTSEKAAPCLTAGGSNADKLAVTPPPSPEDASPGFGGGCRERPGPGGGGQQEELIRRHMFLTRAHRRGHRTLASPASRSITVAAS